MLAFNNGTVGQKDQYKQKSLLRKIKYLGIKPVGLDPRRG